MNDGFVLCDQNGGIAYANKACLQMIRYSQNEVLGHPYSDFCHKESMGVVSKQKELRKKGIKDPYEITMVNKEGQNIYCIVSPQPIFGEKDEFKGSFSTITDISH